MSYDSDRQRLPDLIPPGAFSRRRLDPELVDRHGRRAIPGVEFAAYLASQDPDSQLQIGRADYSVIDRNMARQLDDADEHADRLRSILR